MRIMLAENKALENDLRLKIGGANQAVEVLGQIRKRKVILGEERKVILEEISQLKTLERAFQQGWRPGVVDRAGFAGDRNAGQ